MIEIKVLFNKDIESISEVSQNNINIFMAMKGDPGEPGVKGEKGDKGDKGDPGEHGKDANVDLTAYAKIIDVDDKLKIKVDKVTGKTLTSNDFTDTYKNKLDSLTKITKNSQLENDLNYVTEPKLQEALAKIKTFKIEIVDDELPHDGQADVIYLIKKEEAINNSAYDEYMWINETWELIGSTEVDLTGYVKDYQVTKEITEYDDYIQNEIDKKVDKSQITDSYTTNSINTIPCSKALSDGLIDQLSYVNRSFSDIGEALDKKVDVVDDKGLSTNDFTDILKNKLDNIEDGAEKNKVTSVNSMTGDVTIEAGLKGEKGEQGIQGPVGPKGEKGEPGIQGPPGKDGEQGPQGLTGPKGDQGERGPIGPQGLQGEVGPKGDKGEPGLTGPQGPKGDQGEVGPTGPKGEPGIQGPPGKDGSDASVDLAPYAKTVDVPTKLSQLDNDKNFKTDVEIQEMINSSSKLKKEIIDSLPETGKDDVLYMLKDPKAEDKNAYLEYLWINNSFELIGNTKVDLSGYVTLEKFNSNNQDLYKSLSGLETVVNVKVDEEDGKGLSTNDFTNEDKAQIAENKSSIDGIKILYSNHDKKISELNRDVMVGTSAARAAIDKADKALSNLDLKADKTELDKKADKVIYYESIHKVMSRQFVYYFRLVCYGKMTYIYQILCIEEDLTHIGNVGVSEANDIPEIFLPRFDIITTNYYVKCHDIIYSKLLNTGHPLVINPINGFSLMNVKMLDDSKSGDNNTLVINENIQPYTEVFVTCYKNKILTD